MIIVWRASDLLNEGCSGNNRTVCVCVCTWWMVQVGTEIQECRQQNMPLKCIIISLPPVSELFLYTDQAVLMNCVVGYHTKSNALKSVWNWRSFRGGLPGQWWWMVGGVVASIKDFLPRRPVLVTHGKPESTATFFLLARTSCFFFFFFNFYFE